MIAAVGIVPDLCSTARSSRMDTHKIDCFNEDSWPAVGCNNFWLATRQRIISGDQSMASDGCAGTARLIEMRSNV